MREENGYERRRFLRRVAAGVGAAFAALFGVPAAATALDPALRAAAGGWKDVGALGALPEGAAARVKVPVEAGWEKRHEIAFLVRSGDAVTAFRATCTHSGCTVRFAKEEGKFVCPCHGGEFSLDGAPRKKPVTEPLRKLETRIEDGRVQVRP